MSLFDYVDAITKTVTAQVYGNGKKAPGTPEKPQDLSPPPVDTKPQDSDLHATHSELDHLDSFLGKPDGDEFSASSDDLSALDSFLGDGVKQEGIQDSTFSSTESDQGALDGFLKAPEETLETPKVPLKVQRAFEAYDNGHETLRASIYPFSRHLHCPKRPKFEALSTPTLLLDTLPQKETKAPKLVRSFYNISETPCEYSPLVSKSPSLVEEKPVELSMFSQPKAQVPSYVRNWPNISAPMCDLKAPVPTETIRPAEKPVVFPRATFAPFRETPLSQNIGTCKAPVALKEALDRASTVPKTTTALATITASKPESSAPVIQTLPHTVTVQTAPIIQDATKLIEQTPMPKTEHIQTPVYPLSIVGHVPIDDGVCERQVMDGVCINPDYTPPETRVALFHGDLTKEKDQICRENKGIFSSFYEALSASFTEASDVETQRQELEAKQAAEKLKALSQEPPKAPPQPEIKPVIAPESVEEMTTDPAVATPSLWDRIVSPLISAISRSTKEAVLKEINDLKKEREAEEAKIIPTVTSDNPALNAAVKEEDFHATDEELSLLDSFLETSIDQKRPTPTRNYTGKCFEGISTMEEHLLEQQLAEEVKPDIITESPALIAEVERESLSPVKQGSLGICYPNATTHADLSFEKPIVEDLKPDTTTATFQATEDDIAALDSLLNTTTKDKSSAPVKHDFFGKCYEHVSTFGDHLFEKPEAKETQSITPPVDSLEEIQTRNPFSPPIKLTTPKPPSTALIPVSEVKTIEPIQHAPSIVVTLPKAPTTALIPVSEVTTIETVQNAPTPSEIQSREEAMQIADFLFGRSNTALDIARKASMGSKELKTKQIRGNFMETKPLEGHSPLGAIPAQDQEQFFATDKDLGALDSYLDSLGADSSKATIDDSLSATQTEISDLERHLGTLKPTASVNPFSSIPQQVFPSKDSVTPTISQAFQAPEPTIATPVTPLKAKPSIISNLNNFLNMTEVCLPEDAPSSAAPTAVKPVDIPVKSLPVQTPVQPSIEIKLPENISTTSAPFCATPVETKDLDDFITSQTALATTSASQTTPTPTITIDPSVTITIPESTSPVVTPFSATPVEISALDKYLNTQTALATTSASQTTPAPTITIDPSVTITIPESTSPVVTPFSATPVEINALDDFINTETALATTSASQTTPAPTIDIDPSILITIPESTSTAVAPYSATPVETTALEDFLSSQAAQTETALATTSASQTTPTPTIDIHPSILITIPPKPQTALATTNSLPSSALSQVTHSGSSATDVEQTALSIIGNPAESTTASPTGSTTPTSTIDPQFSATDAENDALDAFLNSQTLGSTATNSSTQTPTPSPTSAPTSTIDPQFSATEVEHDALNAHLENEVKPNPSFSDMVSNSLDWVNNNKLATGAAIALVAGGVYLAKQYLSKTDTETTSPDDDQVKLKEPTLAHIYDEDSADFVMFEENVKNLQEMINNQKDQIENTYPKFFKIFEDDKVKTAEFTHRFEQTKIDLESMEQALIDIHTDKDLNRNFYIWFILQNRNKLVEELMRIKTLNDVAVKAAEEDLQPASKDVEDEGFDEPLETITVAGNKLPLPSAAPAA